MILRMIILIAGVPGSYYAREPISYYYPLHHLSNQPCQLLKFDRRCDNFRIRLLQALGYQELIKRVW